MAKLQDAANEWKTLCENCSVLGVYIDNVRVEGDVIAYTFDGYILCVIYYIDGHWVDVADQLPEEPCPEAWDKFKNGETIEEIYTQLRDEIETPPESVRC